MVFKTTFFADDIADTHKPAISSNKEKGSDLSPNLEIRGYDNV